MGIDPFLEETAGVVAALRGAMFLRRRIVHQRTLIVFEYDRQGRLLRRVFVRRRP